MINNFVWALRQHRLNRASKLIALSVTLGSATGISSVRAHVVALEQNYTYNRLGAFNPSGMLYALRRDVVVSDADDEGDASNISAKRCRSNREFKAGDLIPHDANAASDCLVAGHVQLRPDKRPRPLVLRVIFTNLLRPDHDSVEWRKDPQTGRDIPLDSEELATRRASMHANGLEYAKSTNYKDGIMSDGAASVAEF